MSVTIDRVKCACSDCVCVVDVEKGVKRDGSTTRADLAASTLVAPATAERDIITSRNPGGLRGARLAGVRPGRRQPARR
jgi:DNA invertase Pin-like site-specific DNA recombinase